MGLFNKKVLTQEQQERLVALESEEIRINEEISKASGFNRQSLVIHHLDRLLEILVEVKEYRRLDASELAVIQMAKLRSKMRSRSGQKKINNIKKNLKKINAIKEDDTNNITVDGDT